MSADSSGLLRPSLAKHVSPGWSFGLLLIFLLSAPRFWLVLQANLTGAYHNVSILFLLMMVLPFLLLSRKGRRKIGMRRPANWRWIVGGLFLGIACSGFLFVIGRWLFDQSDHHWFVYIARTYSNVPSPLAADNRLIFFLIYAGISMSFSPIGEELFYRGLIHENFAIKLGDRLASFIDSGAFALVHLAHFGIIYTEGSWQFVPLPATLWVGLLFGCCHLFYQVRKRSGSILGAIVAHAGFNLGMNYFIFYFIL